MNDFTDFLMYDLYRKIMQSNVLLASYDLKDYILFGI